MEKDVVCPTCDSTLLLDGNEAVGDEVFCGYCGGVYKVTSTDTEGEGLEVEEDF